MDTEPLKTDNAQLSIDSTIISYDTECFDTEEEAEFVESLIEENNE